MHRVSKERDLLHGVDHWRQEALIAIDVAVAAQKEAEEQRRIAQEQQAIAHGACSARYDAQDEAIEANENAKAAMASLLLLRQEIDEIKAQGGGRGGGARIHTRTQPSSGEYRADAVAAVRNGIDWRHRSSSSSSSSNSGRSSSSSSIASGRSSFGASAHATGRRSSSVDAAVSCQSAVDTTHHRRDTFELFRLDLFGEEDRGMLSEVIDAHKNAQVRSVSRMAV
jgi:hypothetical protein